MAVALSAEHRALLTLHLLPGLGPRLTGALLERFGSAVATLQAPAAALQEVPHLGAKLAGSIASALHRVDVDAELALMAERGVQLLVHGTPEFPAPLLEIPGPPQLLYRCGMLQAGDAKAVAIVGSRNFTAYGRRIAERLATELVHAGYTVVSGLARGIDGIAHRAALDAGGRTIAVLAGGLARIYPPEHTELARAIEAAGAVLTEAPMHMEPLAGMFPARNRLISGLALGVIVIEAAERSGALITAGHAAEQGRPVFAVPGPLDSPSSAGTHHLVRQGAILIRGVEDILEELEGVRDCPPPTPPRPALELTDSERRLWEFLAERPRHVDEMAQHWAWRCRSSAACSGDWKSGKQSVGCQGTSMNDAESGAG